MAIASQTDRGRRRPSLQELAMRHLWMHFSRMGAYGPDHEIPIIVRGEGCYVYDEHGNRYLDGLSALFCVNAGHGRTELGEAAARQVEELDFYTLWSYAHPRAIELAARIAALAPGDLNRVFFTSGGSEAVESALKLARNYHRMRGNGQKHKVIAREIAYHGTSLGALSATGITELRSQFEPLAPGGCHVPNTNIYRWPEDRHPLWAATAIEERIEFEGPETVAAVILEPVQNAGGCFVPPDGYFQRVREICDRYDVLLISDEVICAWGRLGHYFGCERFGYVPDIITMAKALTSAYAPMGAMIASDRVAEPFMQGDASFAHGFTFAGHPVAAAVAMANLDVFEREDLCGHVLAKEGEFRQMLESLRDLPIVGDVRGAGYFQAIELVKDKETKESFDDEESEDLLRGFLSGELYQRGLICRADDRGDPVIQLAPPLIADTRAVRGDPRRAARRADRGLGAGRRRVRRRRAMLTVQSLLDELGLDLAAGTQAAEAPVRWVHISELEDPTPWLSGGELMLTTGIPLDSAAKQRAFIRLLAEHNLAGLGFGTGFNHKKLPKALRRRGGANATSRSSRCPTRRRSSRSPRRPSPGSSTSSTRCCSAASPCSAGSSGWCSKSAGWRRSSRRSPPRSAAPWRSSTAAASGSPAAASAASSPPRRSTAIRDEALAHTADGHPFVPDPPLGRRPGARPPGDLARRRPAAGLGGDRPRLRRARRLRAADPAAGGRRRRARADAPPRRPRDRAPARRRRARRRARRAPRARRAAPPAASRSGSATRPRCSSSTSTTPPPPSRRWSGRSPPTPARRSSPRTPAGGRELLCAVVDAADRDPVDLAAEARRALINERGAVRAAASRPAPPEDAAPLLPRGALRARGDRASPTATRPRSPPGATSAPSPCCSRSRTTRR